MTLDLDKSSIMNPITNSEHQHCIVNDVHHDKIPKTEKKQKTGDTDKGKNSSKNVTKNMGKLLLKWIWAHR